MGQIDTNETAVAAMVDGDPDEPVVMLNLLNYRDLAEPGFAVDGLSGRDAYGVYGRSSLS